MFFFFVDFCYISEKSSNLNHFFKAFLCTNKKKIKFFGNIWREKKLCKMLLFVRKLIEIFKSMSFRSPNLNFILN